MNKIMFNFIIILRQRKKEVISIKLDFILFFILPSKNAEKSKYVCCERRIKLIVS